MAFNIPSDRDRALRKQHCTCQVQKHTKIMYPVLFNHNRNRSIVRSICTVNVDGEQLTLEFGTHWNINACYGSTRKNKSKTQPVMGPSHVTQRLTRRCYSNGCRCDSLYQCIWKGKLLAKQNSPQNAFTRSCSSEIVAIVDNKARARLLTAYSLKKLSE